jgi:hypothetical protein
VKHRRRIGDQSLGKCLGNFSGEKTRMCIGKRIELPVHRFPHPRMTMAETGDRRPPDASM